MKKLTLISLGVLLAGSLLQASALPAESTAKRLPIPVRWDLGDTLLKVDGSKCLKFLGKFNMPTYMASYLIAKSWFNAKNAVSSWWNETDAQPGRPGIKDHMKELFKDTLTQIPSPHEAPDYAILGVDNKPLPALQRDYILGKLTGEEVMKLIDAWIAKNPDQFAHGLQSSVFRGQMDMYFNHYEEVNKYNTKLLELFKTCHLAHDQHGNKLFTNIICSNWPKGHVEILKAKFPELFKYSDMQLISGEMGTAKPHQDFYLTVPQTQAQTQNSSLTADLETGTNKSSGFIIDDQQNNLVAAAQYGVAGLNANNIEDVAHGLGIDLE